MNYEVWNGRHSLAWLVGVSTCRTSLIISIIISVQVGPTDNCARTPLQMMIVMKTSPAVLPSSGESHENLSSSCPGLISLQKLKGKIRVVHFRIKFTHSMSSKMFVFLSSVKKKKGVLRKTFSIYNFFFSI